MKMALIKMDWTCLGSCETFFFFLIVNVMCVLICVLTRRLTFHLKSAFFPAFFRAQIIGYYKASISARMIWSICVYMYVQKCVCVFVCLHVCVCTCA